LSLAITVLQRAINETESLNLKKCNMAGGRHFENQSLHHHY